MDQAQLEQLEQGIAKALQAGEDPRAIAEAVVQETGVSPEEAMQMVEQVATKLEGGGQGQGNGPRDGSGQGQQGGGITADQALEAFGQIGLSAEQIVQSVQILSQLGTGELEKMLQTIGNAEDQRQEQPAEEENYDNY